uniref:Bifunctional inhibitor/plant lipid transfer protein/seed storage helical domain-containing protein n=1 Tax=Nelumbo nucifera TaxID=4432 RepID=A0A822YNF5_NELNU|nr:TPA_asm: hypothetical protein HUJ06_004687 [Nelumbo nucifera]
MGKFSFVVVVVALVLSVSECQAQQDSSCINEISPCLAFISETKPPSSCCDPLKSVIKSKPQCLCDLIAANAANATQPRINVAQAQKLPAKCGTSFNASSCLAGSPSVNNTANGGTSSVNNTANGTATSSSSQFSPELLVAMATCNIPCLI